MYNVQFARITMVNANVPFFFRTKFVSFFRGVLNIYTTIRRTAVRETGGSRHHRGLIRDAFKDPCKSCFEKLLNYTIYWKITFKIIHTTRYFFCSFPIGKLLTPSDSLFFKWFGIHVMLVTKTAYLADR